MGDDSEKLLALVEIWHGSATDVVALLRQLEPAEWDLPTDLPGWDVRAVAAHLAHLESELAGTPQPQVEVPEGLPHVRGLMGQFTEAGPLARADWPASDVVDELEASVATRYAALQASPPDDAGAPAPGFAGLIGWSWLTLLTNRPLDLWMHEQDIRRAVGRPGGLDSPAAEHVLAIFVGALPFVLAKLAGAAPGQSVVLDVRGAHSATAIALVGENGRGALVDSLPDDPTARLVVDFECFVVRCGGRRRPTELQVVVEGEQDLGLRVFEALATTP